jgi:hypothetical protein
VQWKTKDNPMDGATRERLKFAWLPIKCEDGFYRWLETVRVLEQFGRVGCDESIDEWFVLMAYPAEFVIDGRKPSAPPDFKLPPSVAIPPPPQPPKPKPFTHV